jgi:hypothetical protein
MRGFPIVGGVSVGLMALPALGHVQPYYAPVPISAAAIAADSTLANYKTWDLRVSVTSTAGVPDRFNVADWETALTSGNFYSPVGGGDIPVVPTTANLAYDTYVTVPGHVAGDDTIPVYIPGSGDLSGPGSQTAIFPRASTPTKTEQQTALNAVWGTLGNPLNNGDFPIARFTVSNDANGPIIGYIAGMSSNQPQWGASMNFVNGMLLGSAPAIPLLADTNYDNKVNSTDFVALAQNFNGTSSTWSKGDFNGDGRTNALDFSALATNFGVNSQAPALNQMVPEPAGAVVCALALLLNRRKRAAVR